MLQPTMAGAQTANTNVVAYYEALPNEAVQNQQVTFDATGTYQYADAASRTKQPETALSYSWDFGDGSKATGKTVQHAYPKIGRYETKLTVKGAGGSTDTMSIPVEVIGSTFLGPVLDAIPAPDASDGNFDLKWNFENTREGFRHFRVEESFDFRNLFSDDAEKLDNWTASQGTGAPSWQPSDSPTQKFRGNMRRSGARSFWVGQSPPFAPPVTSTNSYLTLKSPITIPAEGDPELQYWSLFQNEGDDQGRLEVALTTGSTPADQLQWEAVDVIQATNTALGGSDPAVCDPSNPDTLAEGFASRRADLTPFKGKQILIRFNYALGAENRAASQPCGWYVDDISMYTGTWNVVGESSQPRFQVRNRPNLLWAYRVKGVYTDGVATAASNVEMANVTSGKNLPQAELLRCLKVLGNHILGSVEKDVLSGTSLDDVLCAFAGSDKIKGLTGNDTVFAGSGKDVLRGGPGNDLLLGEKGKDKLYGQSGKDRLKGGKKPDLLNGGKGKDKCAGRKDTEKSC
jgi:PKD repeat protein